MSNSFNIRIRWVRNVMGWQRGDETTVTRTAYIDNLIANGMVVVVEDFAPQPPAENATRAAWAEFLTKMGIDFHEQTPRLYLIRMWDDRTAPAAVDDGNPSDAE
ncbi:hypothetical protein [Pseudomonas aeruginosa]